MTIPFYCLLWTDPGFVKPPAVNRIQPPLCNHFRKEQCNACARNTMATVKPPSRSLKRFDNEGPSPQDIQKKVMSLRRSSGYQIFR